MGSLRGAGTPSGSFEAGVREAMVCWNAPRPCDEACDAFSDRALSHHFKGGMPHFTHAAAAVVSQSKVVQAPCLTLVGSLNQP